MHAKAAEQQRDLHHRIPRKLPTRCIQSLDERTVKYMLKQDIGRRLIEDYLAGNDQAVSCVIVCEVITSVDAIGEQQR